MDLFKLAIALTAISCCFATSSTEEGKFFIEPKDLIVSQEGLFVNLQGVLTRVPVVHNDGAGNYILAKELKFLCNNQHPSPNWDGYCRDTRCEYYRR